MLSVRQPQDIHQARGRIENGTFAGRWHFSFDQYHDPAHMHFGALRVFNDDTLSPGATWPLHPHREIEVVTYCAGGVFRHADEHGQGDVLRKGWVQHTTVGRGMYHSEINDLPDQPMRFIQMWFMPWAQGLAPSMQQLAVERPQRLGRFLPLVSNQHPEALPIASPARVYSACLEAGGQAELAIEPGWGAYLYVLEGGPVQVNGLLLPALAAAQAQGEQALAVKAQEEAELLVVETSLS
jgi:redox-sensitive bicupin YhaK (pirin superfamily)